MGFLLCDPALVAQTEASNAQGGEFWERVIAWNTDKRVYFGPVTQSLVYGIFGDLGWPNYEPPGCPVPLRRDARRSLNSLLARVKQPTTAHDGRTPAVNPPHSGGEMVEEAIGEDAASLVGDGLIGLASYGYNWRTVVFPSEVTFDPPPPESLPLVLNPNDGLEAERDENTAEYLRERRITLVGGWGADRVEQALEQRFGLKASQIRWIHGDKTKRPKLDPLDAVRWDRDMVVVVKNYLGHSDSEGVAQRCKKSDVEMHVVEDQNQVIGYLRTKFGDKKEPDS